MRLLLGKHRRDLPLGRAVDPGVGPALVPVVEVARRLFEALEARPLGPDVEMVGPLERVVAHRQAGYGDQLAPGRIPQILALEEPMPRWTAAWTAQQIINAFPHDTAPRYLLRDRDAIYGVSFSKRVKNMGIDEVRPRGGAARSRGR